MSIQDFTPTSLLHAIRVLRTPELDALPDEFLQAPAPRIEPGDMVQGQFGYGVIDAIWAVNGMIGYSIAPLYQMQSGRFVYTSKHNIWAWEDEIWAVLS